MRGMAKYAPQKAKYADYAKIHKNHDHCRKMAKLVNCLKNVHLHVFATQNMTLHHVTKDVRVL